MQQHDTLVNPQPASLNARGQAPDLLLADVSGNPVRLASLWQARPTLLFFLRHFGCALCRAELFRLRERAADFQAHNSTVAVIVPTDAVAATRFSQIYRVPFLLLADPLRQSYRAFGIHEGRLSDAIGPFVMARQLREALHGNWPYIDPQGPTLRQLGGIAIVDQTGSLRFIHVAQPIYDYPSIDTYLQVLEAAQANTPPLPDTTPPPSAAPVIA